MKEAQQESQAIPGLAGLEENVPETLHPILEWGVANAKLVAGIVIGILLIAGGVSVKSTMDAKQLAESRDELTMISVETVGQERIEKLQAYLKDAPEELRLSAAVTLINAAIAEKDYATAEKTFEIFEETGDPMIILTGKLGVAAADIESGKAAKALTDLDAMRATAPEMYKPVIERMIADAAEATGDYAAALSAYQALQSSAAAQQDPYLDYKIKSLSAKVGDNG